MAEAAVPLEQYGKCLSLIEEGQHDQAIALLQEVIRDRPDYVDAYYTLAESLMAGGRYREAEDLCRKLARRLPRDIGVLELWVKALRALDEPRKAAKVCRRILGIRPERERAVAELAELEAEAGRARKAVRFLQTHIRRHGPTPAALTAMGESSLRMGRIERAERYFLRAIDLNPSYGPARRGLESLGRADAVQRAEEALPPDGFLGMPAPEAVEGWLAEGNLLRATRALEERLTRGDTDPHTRIMLARCYERTGRAEEATRLCEELVGESLNRADLHCLLGTLYWRKGDLPEAIESLTLATELEPGYIEAYCQLAMALRQAGKLRPAAHAFQRALELTAEEMTGET